MVPAAAAAALEPDRALHLVLSAGNERVVADTPVQLRAGTVVVHDLGLSGAMLDKLKLRLAADAVTPSVGVPLKRTPASRQPPR